MLGGPVTGEHFATMLQDNQFTLKRNLNQIKMKLTKMLLSWPGNKDKARSTRWGFKKKTHLKIDQKIGNRSVHFEYW